MKICLLLISTLFFSLQSCISTNKPNISVGNFWVKCNRGFEGEASYFYRDSNGTAIEDLNGNYIIYSTNIECYAIKRTR